MKPNPLRPGERILLVDERGHRYLVRLATGETFHFHAGAIPHDMITGCEEGTVVHSTTGAAVTCLRPRLRDVVMKMPRGAQVLYPKDIGSILIEADIFPGAAVLEAGTGSGALCLALTRAVGPEGRVVSYEIRPDFHEKAMRNVEAEFGRVPDNLDLRLGDLLLVQEANEAFHRIVLDLPDPRHVLDAAQSVAVAGGILCAFLPTTGQVQELVLELRSRSFAEIETFEIMRRTWHVAERSVRPDHRMVAHTGFITTARVPSSQPP